MYVRGKWICGFDDISECKKIRKTVFQDEQGFTEQDDFDEKDICAMHLLVYAEEQNEKAPFSLPIGTGRLLMENGTFIIGRIAILKEYRGKKFGDFLVRILIDKAFSAGAGCVQVNAQKTAEGFYEKLGFMKKGEPYYDHGVLHQAMEIFPCAKKCGCK